MQRSAYFGQPENILLAILADSWKHVRELSFWRILKYRQIAKVEQNVHEFKIPILIFKADDYIDLTGWHSVPWLLNHCLQYLFLIINLRQSFWMFLLKFIILRFPYHSQAGEHCVKLVTEASAVVCSNDARDEFIRTRIASRILLPKFENKNQNLQVL